ncbi:MAG: cellulase family glycosylhydrolase [Pirellulales bacterium]|nr:cellulase family glycosylhydrolase [Pirellulales bacterium]
MKISILRCLLTITFSITVANYLHAEESKTGHDAKNPAAGRWSCDKANQWYAKQPWLVGCNFIASTAINQLEMWQADTFDPKTIDRELGWAAGLGFNVVRVYLHDLAYQQDPDGFLERIDKFLSIADRHGIKALLVIFDDCWLAEPKAGKQPEPWPGVHNSGWLESPGQPQLKRYPTDPALRERLEKYVKAVLTRFGKDPRVLMWDLYNEPGGWWYRRGDKPGSFEKGLSNELCMPLLRDVYCWARQVNPSQPITTCWNRGAYEEEPALKWADVVTFHHYNNLSSLQKLIDKLRKGAPNRPLICTEYLNREGGSRFQTHLPLFSKQRIGAINWGLVAGKTNTMWAWKSWNQPGTPEPKSWHHDILRKDGTPFDVKEIAVIRFLTKE